MLSAVCNLIPRANNVCHFEWRYELLKGKPHWIIHHVYSCEVEMWTVVRKSVRWGHTFMLRNQNAQSSHCLWRPLRLCKPSRCDRYATDLHRCPRWVRPIWGCSFLNYKRNGQLNAEQSLFSSDFESRSFFEPKLNRQTWLEDNLWCGNLKAWRTMNLQARTENI